MTKNLLARSQVHDSEHVVDEGEGGVATFDGKWSKVIEEILEWREGGLVRKENKGTYEKRP